MTADLQRPIRVLHCPTTVGGNPTQLACAERELGLQSISVALEQNYLGYPADEILSGPDASKLRRGFKRMGLLWRAIRDFDVIHYNFGSTILPQPKPPAARQGSRVAGLVPNGLLGAMNTCELAMLKKAGKGLVVTYQGDDARQKAFSLANFDISIAHEADKTYYPKDSDRYRQQNIALFEKYADRIYALNPDLLHVLPERAKFIPYANVDPRQWQPVTKALTSCARPVVLHAPTHHVAKGTGYVLDVVNRLKSEGQIDFEFVLVEGLSHWEARKLYERADLIIDQLLVGWYGGLAVEAMALGKAVICYIRQSDLKFVPRKMAAELPIISATSETLYDVLKESLTSGKDQLPVRGIKGRTFVERWHDPLNIAAMMKRDYEAILASKLGKGVSNETISQV